MNIIRVYLVARKRRFSTDRLWITEIFSRCRPKDLNGAPLDPPTAMWGVEEVPHPTPGGATLPPLKGEGPRKPRQRGRGLQTKDRKEKPMKPSIGRIVHYITPDDPLPAIIVSVNPENEVADLQVFTDQKNPSVFFAGDVSRRSHDTEIYCWDWPPRVE